MDKQPRPLQEYFEAARHEPGISEQEVRAIVRRGSAGRALVSLRRLGAVIGAAGAVAIGYAVLGGSPDEFVTAGATRSIAASGDRIAPTSDPIVTQYQSNPSTTHSISKETDTMKSSTIMRGALATVAAVGMATSADAQTTTERPRTENREEVRIHVRKEISPVMEQMASELGASAARFWTDRLNSYKSRIDRIVGAGDLEKLNRMRVRFGVMVAEHASIAQSSMATAHEETENVIVDESSEGERREVRRIEVKVNGSDADAMEFLTLHQGAKEIASAYRGDFDNLAKDVLADAATFLRTLKDAGDRFVAEHRVEIEKTEGGRSIAMGLSEGDEIISALSDPETQPMIQMVYAMALEPLILLYDGSDLNSFFSQAGPLSSAVTGLNLPETSALKQNVPNPAVTKTSIPYVLEESSSATMLRLYDATGALVGTYDQGAREAGEHAASVDVSSLPGGVYLYHLTVKTSGGERVYSKTMQVTK